MSKSAPFNIVVLFFAPVWESDERYKGSEYPRSGRDLRAAKQWLELNPIEEIDPESFQKEVQSYLRTKFEGATSRNHPCWLFLDYYGEWGTRKREVVTVKRKLMIHCIDCQHDHGINDPCPQNQPTIKG